MGKPSDRRRRARRRRPGKSERIRVKKPRRGKSWHHVPSAGTLELKAGRKKQKEFYRSRSNPFGWKFRFPIQTGNHISKASTGKQ